MTGAMISAGGVVAYLYVASDVELTPILAANVGAAAPLIIGRFVENAPVTPGSVN